LSGSAAAKADASKDFRKDSGVLGMEQEETD
jgi:hypothetical protein